MLGLNRVKLIAFMVFLLFFTGVAQAGNGININLSNKDINFGFLTKSDFEDESDVSDLGFVQAHVNVLLVDEGSTYAVDGLLAVGRTVPLDSSEWNFGVGIRPIAANIKQGSTTRATFAVQLGGVAEYRISVGEVSDFYIATRAFYSPDIITFSDDFDASSHYGVQVGIFIVANTAVYVEYAQEKFTATKGGLDGDLIDGAFFGLRFGL